MRSVQSPKHNRVMRETQLMTNIGSRSLAESICDANGHCGMAAVGDFQRYESALEGGGMCCVIL